MEENKELIALLQKIEKHNRRQVWLTRIMCLAALAAVLICVFALSQMVALLPQVGSILTQAQTVLKNLEDTTRGLAQADLAGMAENVDALVLSGQESLGITMQKLNAIDIETLNSAIADLAAVVEPMAKFFGNFR